MLLSGTHSGQMITRRIILATANLDRDRYVILRKKLTGYYPL